MNCNKRKYDKLGAMYALSQTKRLGKSNPSRNEKRIYYCNKCNSYHLTFQKNKLIPISFEEATGMSVSEFEEIENMM